MLLPFSESSIEDSFYSIPISPSLSEDELPPDEEPPLEEAPELPPLGMQLFPESTAELPEVDGASLLTKYFTLVMSNFSVHIVNERRIIIFIKDECKGVYHFHQSTVCVITCCTSSF